RNLPSSKRQPGPPLPSIGERRKKGIFPCISRRQMLASLLFCRLYKPSSGSGSSVCFSRFCCRRISLLKRHRPPQLRLQLQLLTPPREKIRASILSCHSRPEEQRAGPSQSKSTRNKPGSKAE